MEEVESSGNKSGCGRCVRRMEDLGGREVYIDKSTKRRFTSFEDLTV